LLEKKARTVQVRAFFSISCTRQPAPLPVVMVMVVIVVIVQMRAMDVVLCIIICLCCMPILVKVSACLSQFIFYLCRIYSIPVCAKSGAVYSPIRAMENRYRSIFSYKRILLQRVTR